MKIAIHYREDSFTDNWIEYCKKNDIQYTLVDAFDNNIINSIRTYNIFLWHHHQAQFKDVLVAKRLLYCLDHTGTKVYPDFKTGWHFDDKVAQKYLLEAIEAPMVKSYVFYDKDQAVSWIQDTNFPKVFKLRGGAESNNVKLLRSKKEAIKITKQAFGKGIAQFNKIESFKEKWRKFKLGEANLLDILKGLVRIIISTDFDRKQPKEKGYVYFQDFIPNNKFDVRVVVIGGKFAAAEKRFVRENDFRASGSGIYCYEDINLETVKIAFQVAKKLSLQTVAFDFIFDENKKPLIVEISYGFGHKGISNVPGYWDEKLNWIDQKFEVEKLILQELGIK